jgi:hypothetical protein
MSIATLQHMFIMVLKLVRAMESSVNAF